MKKYKQILETLKLDINLNRSSPDALTELAKQAHIVHFDRGEYIFSAGEATDYVYLVEKGKVIMSREADSGKSFIFLIAIRGIPLNAVTCFMEKTRLFSARVAENATLVAIPSAVFRRWVLAHPCVTEGILETMGILLDGAYTRIMDLIDQSAEARIVNAMNMLFKKIGSDLPMTNGDIAEMTGVSRETAARVISHLHRLGLISKTRGAIRILDHPKLEALSTSPFFTL